MTKLTMDEILNELGELDLLGFHYVPTLAELTTVPTLGQARENNIPCSKTMQRVEAVKVAFRKYGITLQDRVYELFLNVMSKMGYEPVPHFWALLMERPVYLPETKQMQIQIPGRDGKPRTVKMRVGRYLKQRFPKMSDHILRDVVQEFTLEIEVKICHDTDLYETIVGQVDSCMSDCYVRDVEGVYRHPYEVYDPRFGWGVAYAEDKEGRVTHRALVWECPNTGMKQFGRSYHSETCSNGYSQRDRGFESKLEELGYEFTDDWVGKRLDKILVERGYLMPYIDGESQAVMDCGDHWEIVWGNDTEADAVADSTEGVATPNLEVHFECEDCGRYARRDEENHVYQGDYYERYVCDTCFDDYVAVPIPESKGGGFANVRECDTEFAADEHGEFMRFFCDYVDDHIAEGLIVEVGNNNLHIPSDYRFYLSTAVEWVLGLGFVPNTDRELLVDNLKEFDVVRLSVEECPYELDEKGLIEYRDLYQIEEANRGYDTIKYAIKSLCAITSDNEYVYAGCEEKGVKKGFSRLTRPYKGTWWVQDCDKVVAGDGVFHPLQEQYELPL